MRKIFPIIWQDDFVRQGFGMALIFCLLGLFLLAFFWLKLPPQIPLFYSHTWGEEQLAAPGMLFFLPGIAIFILLGNVVTAGFLSAEEKLLTRILALASSLVAFLSLYILIRILLLVI